MARPLPPDEPPPVNPFFIFLCHSERKRKEGFAIYIFHQFSGGSRREPPKNCDDTKPPFFRPADTTELSRFIFFLEFDSELYPCSRGMT